MKRNPAACRTITCLLASILSISAITAHCQAPTEISSPDGKSQVRMLDKPMPGADPYLEFFTLEVLSGKKVITREPTMGYLMSAHWSPDGQWLAVNNRRANSGDYVWIFSLPAGRCIKRPDDVNTIKWEKAASKAIRMKVSGETLKSWITTSGFNKDGTLSLQVREKIHDDGIWDFDAKVSLPNLKIVTGKASQTKSSAHQASKRDLPAIR